MLSVGGIVLLLQQLKRYGCNYGSPGKVGRINILHLFLDGCDPFFPADLRKRKGRFNSGNCASRRQDADKFLAQDTISERISRMTDPPCGFPEYCLDFFNTSSFGLTSLIRRASSVSR